MTCYFGLYFGNSNMCLAMHKDSKTEVLANAAGYRVTPSVIAFINESEKVVGLDAKQAMNKNSTNVITNIKDLISTDANVDLSDYLPKAQSKVNNKNKVDQEKNGIIPENALSDVLSILFENMKDIACSHSHEEEEYPTIVTVPSNFTSMHRLLVKKAVNRAGFKLLRIINESAAAALAYDIGQDSQDATCKCLIYRLGGTSLDVTVLDVNNGMYSVISSISRKTLGGNLITNAIVDFCANEFKRQYKIDLKESKRSVMKVRMAAEHYKQVVYSSINERCQAESVYDGIDLNVNISKARFDSLIHSTLLQCLEPIQEALMAAELTANDINTVILCGGSCKLPKLQQLISNLFPSSKILSSISPDEVIAVGAAKQATFVTQHVNEEDCFVNMLTKDLFLKLIGFSNSPEELLLCSKGTLIPTVVTQSFTATLSSNYKVEIYEGISEASSLVATFSMPNLPEGDVYFTFFIRSDGSLTVTCEDCSSKELGSATIVPSRSQEYT
uniref:Heat shock protein 14 n=1 Tax=Parasteatoda tepidariorum TaxID=114398 RepID=A0A2L2Y747_PARTP